MLDSQIRLQKYFRNAKTTKFLSELDFYTSEGHTWKVLSFYDFWFTFNDKFCSPYPIVDFYAYLITKIGNRNLKKCRLRWFIVIINLLLFLKEMKDYGFFCYYWHCFYFMKKTWSDIFFIGNLIWYLFQPKIAKYSYCHMATLGGCQVFVRFTHIAQVIHR